MSEQLWLRQPRPVVKQRGYGICHLPGDVRANLTGAYAIDPLTGYACCRPVYTMDDPLLWLTGSDENWVDVEPFMSRAAGVWVAGKCHRAAGGFRACTDPLPAGLGFYFGFAAYTHEDAFELTCGPGWRLRLRDGLVELRTTSDEPAAAMQFWGPDEWLTDLHYLYVYAVADRLCVRPWGGLSTGGRPWTDRTGSPGLAVTVPVDAGGTALPAARLWLAGSGYLTVGAAPERHETGLTVQHQVMALPEPAAMDPEAEASTLAPAGAVVTMQLLGAGGGSLPAASVEAPLGQFGYRLSATGVPELGANLYLTRVRVRFPARIESDGQVPFDLLTLDPAGLGGAGGVVQAVELRRGLDPDSCGLSLHLATGRAQLTPYIRPHMKGQWIAAGGASEAVFYTSRPLLRTPLNQDLLQLDVELGWKLLKSARCGGDLQLAGLTLAAAYREVARRAGLPDDQIVTSGSYVLPAETPEGEAQFDFRPDQTLAEILTYLRDQFSPLDLLRFTPDGKLHADPRPTTSSGVTFYTGETPPEELADVAAGWPTVPRVYADSWQEEFDEAGFANEVYVVGEGRDGVPLVAVATDWPSIHGYGVDTRPPFNYVAETRRMVIVDAGLTSQALVNWVARSVLSRVRLLRLRVSFTSIWVPGLLPGDLVSIEGRGTWRLLSYARTSDGPWADRVTYQVEQEVG